MKVDWVSNRIKELEAFSPSSTPEKHNVDSVISMYKSGVLVPNLQWKYFFGGRLIKESKNEYLFMQGSAALENLKKKYGDFEIWQEPV